jgi:hypothetical protein
LSTMKSLLTIAVCNLFQSLNNLMLWYASNHPGIPKCFFQVCHSLGLPAGFLTCIFWLFW